MVNLQLYHFFALLSRKIGRTMPDFSVEERPLGPRRIHQKFCHLEQARGSYATKGESKDPDNPLTMQLQGILSVLLRPCRKPIVQARRAKALPGFRTASPLHDKKRHPGDARGCRGVCFSGLGFNSVTI